MTPSLTTQWGHSVGFAVVGNRLGQRPGLSRLAAAEFSDAAPPVVFKPGMTLLQPGTRTAVAVFRLGAVRPW
jgi:hypothetical protein